MSALVDMITSTDKNNMHLAIDLMESQNIPLPERKIAIDSSIDILNELVSTYKSEMKTYEDEDGKIIDILGWNKVFPKYNDYLNRVVSLGAQLTIWEIRNIKKNKQ